MSRLRGEQGRDEQGAQRVLAEVGTLLVSSLDYEETLAGIAELAVRSLADFCIIDIVEDGEVRRHHAAHADPDRAELIRELLKFPLDRRRPYMSLEAIETGKSVLVRNVSSAFLETTTQGKEHRRILEALRPRSFMAVPLSARGQLLGAVVFVSSGRTYDETDLALAERMVQLAALYVDNARLYDQARQDLLARDRVLGIVAHDLRNPLNAIIMSTEILVDRSFSEVERIQQAQMILRSAHRMERLIQDLLDVASIEADRLNLYREVLDPGEIVQEAMELDAALAQAKNLSLHCEPSENVQAISADHDRLLQVMSNLIGNAIKFTPEGGEIRVSVVRVEEEVRFAVSDTGSGISSDDLPRVFQPFWQSRRRNQDGAGLGLMIARGIVEAHGGRIWAESTPGLGSTFYFTIPVLFPPPQGEGFVGPADRVAGSTMLVESIIDGSGTKAREVVLEGSTPLLQWPRHLVQGTNST
jgi:signal transduction histidine kinase